MVKLDFGPSEAFLLPLIFKPDQIDEPISGLTRQVGAEKIRLALLTGLNLNRNREKRRFRISRHCIDDLFFALDAHINRLLIGKDQPRKLVAFEVDID